MFGSDVFLSPPQHVNAAGVKFWFDRESTGYARSKGLDQIIVFYVEEANGSRTRLVTEHQQPLHECTSIEGIACYLDVLAFARHDSQLQGG